MAIIYGYKDKVDKCKIVGASVKEPILDKSMNEKNFTYFVFDLEHQIYKPFFSEA
jgi:hypothetical protein